MWSDAAGLQALMSIGRRRGYEHAGLPHERRIESITYRIFRTFGIDGFFLE